MTSGNSTHNVFRVVLDKRNGVQQTGSHVLSSDENHTLPSFTLTNGIRIPMVGWGTGSGQQPDQEKQALGWALDAGYTLFGLRQLLLLLLLLWRRWRL